MATCKYCEKTKKLTREHVTPDFIYKLIKHQDGEHISWNSNFDDYKLNVESVIKDVCATCNNKYLAKLDSYGQDFVENNNIHKATYLTNLVLYYDYELLSRWLLKIAYNSTRMTKGDISDFTPLINWILYGEKDCTPSNKYFFIILELLKPQLAVKRINTLFIALAREGNFIQILCILVSLVIYLNLVIITKLAVFK